MPTSLSKTRMVRLNIDPKYVDQVLLGLAHSGISIWVENEPAPCELSTTIMFEVSEDEIY